MTRFRVPALLIVSLLAIVPISSAQVRSGTVEINPFAGYLFGGRFPAGSLSLFDTKVDVDDHATYGGRLGWNITSKVELEAQFSRTETSFVTPGSHELFGDSGQRLGDLRIDYLLGYGTFNFGRGRAVPYVTFGMGAARLTPDVCRGATKPCVNPDTDTRFTASAGIGLKAFMTPHFGLRFDGRYYGTWLRDSNRDRCGDRRCDNRTDWLSNGDVTGGLIFAF